MTFDYFNVSHLAFGAKITRAFTQLYREYLEGQENLAYLKMIYQNYSEYIDRNYPAPFPNRPDAPVRAKELYDVINDANTLRSVRLNEDGELEVKAVLYKRASNRFTIAEGTTDLKEGYCFCQDSVSNKNYTREINFTDDYQDGKGNFLFQFRIDDEDNINIIGDTFKYYIPTSFDHITSMKKDETIFTKVTPSYANKYVAKDYEVILVVGYAYGESGNPSKETATLNVIINNQTVLDITGRFLRQFGVVYLKPGDELQASCSTAFKVKYISGESVPPQPTEPTEPPTPDVSIESWRKQYRLYDWQTMTGWRFSGDWTYTESEQEFTGDAAYGNTLPNTGAAAGVVLTLDRPITSADLYKLSFNFRGNIITPYYTSEVTDRCQIEFINSLGQTISTVSYAVNIPSPDPGGVTTQEITDVEIPATTYRIRISNLGFTYNSGQQRFYCGVSANNISLTM